MRYLLLLLLFSVSLAAPGIQLLVGGKEVSFFRPTDHTLNFRVDLSTLKLGQTKAKWRFLAVETASGDKGLIKEAETSGLVTSQVDGTLTLPRDWPYGSYKAELYLNGKLHGTYPYIVSPAVDELKARGHGLFLDNGKGELGKKVEHFTPKDHMQHFAVGINGFVMGKAKVARTFVAVDTSQGKNQTITTLEKDVSNFQGDTLTSHIELPRDWPTGKYRAEVTLNGRALDKIDYEVK